MRIEAPVHFRHAGDLSPRYASHDPRAAHFSESRIELDLRPCDFVRPPAVLWCLIYPLLAQAHGVSSILLVPESVGVCTYLKSVGLFELLKDRGVGVDDRGISKRQDQQLILPLTHFDSQSAVEDLANKALDALSSSGLGSSNLYPLVSEIFAELGLNAVEHSESPIGGFGFIQFYEFAEGRRFVCGVADGGIGIRRSLERNPELRERVHYDWSAIELAVRERVSGTGEGTRGIGLYGVAEDMRSPRRQLILHSGLGSLQISEDMESEARRTTLFPGTLAYASIPG